MGRKARLVSRGAAQESRFEVICREWLEDRRETVAPDPHQDLGANGK
jgi:hypothetical protein